jgi:polysaccharide pyruvyl transferase WcaK-like protein
VQVVDMLDTEKPHIDILLVGVDPHNNGMKMLKYINEEFQHIPAIITKLFFLFAICH